MTTLQKLGTTLVARQTIAWSATRHLAWASMGAIPDTRLAAGCTGNVTGMMALEMSTRDLALLLAGRAGRPTVAVQAANMTTILDPITFGLAGPMDRPLDLKI